MIEQHGVRCDVCGNFILVGLAASFQLGGIEGTLTAHESRCIDLIRKASGENDITVLPDGPIRKAFEELKELTREKS